jgi:ribose transport system substrate-binding protein
MRSPGVKSEANLMNDRYLVGAILQAHQVMSAFHRNEVLRLRDIVERTGLPKATAFRIIHTLSKMDFIEKCDLSRYRLRVLLPKKKRFRIGFDMNGLDTVFTGLVRQSLMQAAAKASIELLTLDNQDGALSLSNADTLIAEGVDLAIVFQGQQSICETLAAKYAAAGVPTIAIDTPVPGAYFFGANNYRAGLMAGRYLGKWAINNWKGISPDVILLEYRRAGPVPQSRVEAMLAGFRHSFRHFEKCPVFRLDTIGNFGSAYDQVQKHLKQNGSRHTLVAAVNDVAALGALKAFAKFGNDELCAVVSQNADQMGRSALRQPQSRLIGSVAYFPERYGDSLIALARNILTGSTPPPPATFTRHALVTPENVDRFYASDALDSRADAEIGQARVG